jgi:hypothetical protein
MPSAGLTKIQGVNRVLRAVNELPVTVLETGGPNIVSRAEEVLDEARVAYLIRGWDQENIYRAKRYTPSGSPAKIQLDADVLRIRGAANCEHRSFQIRGGYVFDMNRYSNEFTDTEIFLDVAVDIPWDDLSPGMKEAIADEAFVAMQRYYRGSPDQDSWAQERRARTESMVGPWKQRAAPPEFNFVPVTLQPREQR